MLTPLTWALAHCCMAWTMVGMIWMVQLVHYPLMRRVSRAYHEQHMDVMGAFVAPLMLLDLVLATLPCLGDLGGIGRGILDAVPALRDLAVVPRERAWGGAGLLGIVWVSTAALSVPTHEALLSLLRSIDSDDCEDAAGTKAQREALWHRLVRTNWVRVAFWSLRGLLAAELVLWAAAEKQGAH
jgi:hypothetical protein